MSCSTILKSIGFVGVAAICLCFTAPNAQAAGPDVILSGIPSVASYGPGTVPGIRAYSIGSYTCNIGTDHLAWNNSTLSMPLTPGLAMNAYRLHDGRLMQIGMSWVKTACCVANGSGCSIGCQSGPSNTLHIGCRDHYSASWNASQNRFGPRSRVDAYGGAYGPLISASGDVVFRRLQIHENDMNLINYPGARFFVEGVYAATDDAATGNWLNNASYQGATFNSYVLGLTGSFHLGIPAIYAWRDHGNGPNVPDPSVEIQNVDVPNEGRFIVACKVRDNGNGTWRYDYAVYNLNSHRSGGGFSVPVPASVNVTDIGFNDVNYHSGEVYDNTDWSAVRELDAVQWSSPQTHAQNENSNALRWGTMYNFWFTADRGPDDVQIKLDMFRPGTPDSVVFVTKGPQPLPCTADVAPPGGDGAVDVSDLLSVINSWGACAGCPADTNSDDVVDVTDLLAIINNWGPCS